MMMPDGRLVDDESDDPRNALLDALDAMLDAIKRNDLEYQARRRIAKFLPPEKPQPGLFDRRPDANTELELTIFVRDCQLLAKKPMSEISHQAIARMKERAEAELAAMKQGRAA